MRCAYTIDRPLDLLCSSLNESQVLGNHITTVDIVDSIKVTSRSLYHGVG